MAYLGYSATYIHICHVQSCDMSVSHPLVTRIHNGTTCVHILNFCQNGCTCVLKDIVDVKQVLDKNMTSFLR